jgi:hypothetical protein
MAKRRGKSRVKVIPLTIGQDPSLWRYGSLQEALGANTDILSALIRAGQDAQAQSPTAGESIFDGEADEFAAR